MTVDEIRDAISVVKEEMRTAVETADTEKRSLNDDEKAAFEANQAKINDLNAQLAQAEAEAQRSVETNVEPKEKSNQTNIRMKNTKKLADAMCAIANNRSTEDYSFVKGNTISLRDYEGTVHNDTEAIDDEQALDLLEPLQDAYILNKLGLKVFTTNKALRLPSVANIEAEVAGEGVELTGKVLDFDSTPLQGFRIGVSIPLTRESFVQADRDVVDYATKLGAKAIGNVLNKIICSPAAVAGKEGPFVGVADASAMAITYKNVINLNAAVKAANVDCTYGAYICSPSVEAKLKTTPVEDGDSKMILEGNSIDGFPVIVSQACADASTGEYLGFGAWDNLYVQAIDTNIVVDNISKSKQNVVEVNENTLVAFEIARPEAFEGFLVSA